uniref:Uncharacterized protein n=1 Tax=Arundo donax TaxID=35708 RepID=A0A0A9G8N4_ARUDO
MRVCQCKCHLLSLKAIFPYSFNPVYHLAWRKSWKPKQI